jgi:amidase
MDASAAPEPAARVRSGELSAVEAAPRPDGTPTPVQFVGRAGSETRLLWLAGELERRLPWRRYAPAFDPLVPAGSTAT